MHEIWSFDSQENQQICCNQKSDFKAKCTKFKFDRGSAPYPAGGAYSAPPDPLAGFKGPTCDEWDGKGWGMGGDKGGQEGREERSEERKGRERRDGKGGDPQSLGSHPTFENPEKYSGCAYCCIIEQIK